MASVQNCSLLQKDSTDERNGVHARPYWIAPNASCPDMVGLAARGARIAWFATGKESAASLREGMQYRIADDETFLTMQELRGFTVKLEASVRANVV
jgi:hypothetical protein